MSIEALAIGTSAFDGHPAVSSVKRKGRCTASHRDDRALSVGTRAGNAFETDDPGKLKETKECASCNLSGADLSGVDLSGVKLNRTNMSSVTLPGAHLRYATLTGAAPTGAELTGADLTGATPTDALP